MASWASAGCLVWVAKHPQLVLLDRGQTLVLLCSVFPVLNGASIKFSLAGQILLAVPSTLATATATATGHTTASPSPQGGHLTCFGRFSRLLRELEVHISFLHSGEGHAVCGSGKDRGPNCVKALVSNTLLEPEDLEALGKGFNAVFPKVIVVVVPCHMEGNTLVEVEVPPIAVILKRLESGHDGASGRHQLLAAQEMGMKNPKRLASILGLCGSRARVGPWLGSSPGCVEDVIYLGRVLDKGWVKGSMFLEIIQWSSKLGVGQVKS
jgi:hypothetical protein